MMQDIWLDKVRFKNVRQYIDDMEMDFPDGFTLFIGKNGAGKSTIFKAISMAFYGDDGSPKGERLTVSDLVNRQTKKDLEIHVNFRIIENDITDNYEIDLYQDHKKFKNRLIFTKNKIDISGQSKTETYKIIENLLYPRDVYHNVVCFSQQIKDFFTALTNSEQKQIFDSIFITIKDYNIYAQNTFKAIKNVNELIQKLELKSESLKDNIDIKIKSRDQLVKDKENKIQDNNRLLNESKELKFNKENEMEKIQIEFDQISFDENIFKMVQKQIVDLKIERARLEQELKNLKISLDNKLEQEVQRIEYDLNKKKDQEKIVIGEDKSKKLKVYDDQLQDILNQQYQLSKKYDCSDLINKKDSSNTESQKEILFINLEIETVENEFDISDTEKEKKNRLLIIDNNIKEILDKAASIKELYSSVKSSVDEKQNIIDEDQEKLNKSISVCSKCLRPFTTEKEKEIIRDSINKIKDEINILSEQIKNYKIQIAELKKDYEETIELKNKTEKNYDEKIQDILNRKNNKRDVLLRKRKLIEDELSSIISNIQSEINQKEELKSKEESILTEEKQKIRNEMTIINEDFENQIQNLDRVYLNDLLKIKKEHIYKYSGEFSLQEKEISEKISVIDV